MLTLRGDCRRRLFGKSSVSGRPPAGGYLLDNALRYAAEGGRIAVSCRCPQRDGKDLVCLQVADDGPGVPEAERGRIFDRFYRVPGNGGRGSGIGLSLVARIAQRHGAEIEVGEGLEGRGFSIAVWFPAAPPA